MAEGLPIDEESFQREWAQRQQGLPLPSSMLMGEAETPSAPVAATTPPFNPVANPVSGGNAGGGIRDILGTIGSALQGFSSGYRGRPNPAIQQRLEEAQLAQRQQQIDMQSLEMSFKIAKEISDVGNLSPEHAEKIGNYLSKMGRGTAPPELWGAFLSDTSTRDTIQRIFPLATKHLGIAGTLKQLKVMGKDGLKDWEKQLTEQDVKARVGQARQQGLIKEGMPQIEAEKVIPDISRLSPEDMAAYGIVSGKEKMALAAADRAETRQDKALAATESRFQRSLEKQDERLELSERKARMLLPSQQKILTGNRTAIKTIDNYEKAFDDYIKESKGGAFSDMVRGGIAKNLTAQRAADLVFIEGRTPAEKKFAAEYNAMIGSVKSLTDEVGVLTDLDVPRIMGSFNPAVERGQFKANISARRRLHQRTIDTNLEDFQAMGKDISGFLESGTRTQSRETPVEAYERDPATGKLRLKK